jgi:hypothetical protein
MATSQWQQAQRKKRSSLQPSSDPEIPVENKFESLCSSDSGSSCDERMDDIPEGAFSTFQVTQPNVFPSTSTTPYTWSQSQIAHSASPCPAEAKAGEQAPEYVKQLMNQFSLFSNKITQQYEDNTSMMKQFTQQCEENSSTMKQFNNTLTGLSKTLNKACTAIEELTVKVADIQLVTIDLRVANQELEKKFQELQNRMGALDKIVADQDTIRNTSDKNNLNSSSSIVATVNRLSEKIISWEKNPPPLPSTYLQALRKDLDEGKSWELTQQGTNHGTRKNTNNPKEKATKQTKPLQALYPKAAREVRVSFQNAKDIEVSRDLEDKALEVVNSEMARTAIQSRIFHSARFSLSRNLILSTGLHTSNENLAGFLTLIEDTLTFIGPASAQLSSPWTKFLLHGVPTQMELSTIRRDVEQYCPSIKLGQTPRWLAPLDKRENKSASTVVLAFLGTITFETLGGRSMRVGNRTCTLTPFIQFGIQTQCSNCQGLGHPKDFCKARTARCAVCAANHLTSEHPCSSAGCKGGYPCLHQSLKCANCQGPHRSTDRNCPEKVKVSQEFRERIRQRLENRMD